MRFRAQLLAAGLVHVVGVVGLVATGALYIIQEQLTAAGSLFVLSVCATWGSAVWIGQKLGDGKERKE